MTNRLLTLAALLLVASGSTCMWVAGGNMHALLHPLHMLAMLLSWGLLAVVFIILGRMGWESIRGGKGRSTCPDCGRKMQPDWQHCPWCNARLR